VGRERREGVIQKKVPAWRRRNTTEEGRETNIGSFAGLETGTDSENRKGGNHTPHLPQKLNRKGRCRKGPLRKNGSIFSAKNVASEQCGGIENLEPSESGGGNEIITSEKKKRPISNSAVRCEGIRENTKAKKNPPL